MLLNVAPDHLDRHGDMAALRGGEAARCSPTRAPGDVAVLPAAARGSRRRARRGACRFGSGAPAPTCALDAGSLWLAGRAAARDALGAAPARRPQRSRTRWPPRRSASRAASPPTPSATALAASPASRTASRRSRRVDGVLYVNDSKATNVASTLVALRRVRARAACTLILGGRGKGQDFTALRDAGRRARARRLPDRRGRRGGSRGARRACALQCSVRHARARARRGARGRRAPARSCCSARPARASTSSATSRRAARRSAAGPLSRRARAPWRAGFRARRRRRLDGPVAATPGRVERTGEPPCGRRAAAAARAQHAADRDAVPARAAAPSWSTAPPRRRRSTAAARGDAAR